MLSGWLIGRYAGSMVRIRPEKSARVCQCDYKEGISTLAQVLTRPLRSRLPEGYLFIAIPNDKGRSSPSRARIRNFIQ